MTASAKKGKVAYPAVLYEVPFGWNRPGDHPVYRLTKARRRVAEWRKSWRAASLDGCLIWKHIGDGNYHHTAVEVTVDAGDVVLTRTGRAERIGREWRLVEVRTWSRRLVRRPDAVLQAEGDVARSVERREAA